MEIYKLVLETFTALMTPTVAIIAVYIARQQWKLAAERYRHELYDRRLAVFQAVRMHFGSIIREGKCTEESCFALSRNTVEAEFLFDRDVCDFIKELLKRSWAARALRATYDPLPVGSERAGFAQQEHEHLMWFVKESDKLHSQFARYFKLTSS